MKARLEEFCPDYFEAPERYRVYDETPLLERYDHLQLRDTSELRLGRLCTDGSSRESISGASAPSN